MQLQHYRKNDAMENNIILAYKMNQFGFFIVPVRFPVFSVIQAHCFGGTDITDWRIKPYIQHFSFCSGNGTFTPQSRSLVTALGCKPASIQLLHWPSTLVFQSYWCSFKIHLRNQSSCLFKWQIPVLCLFFYRWLST